MILSILIPSIPERKDRLDKLKWELDKQIIQTNRDLSLLGRIEILVNDSVRFLEGGLSIGKKRESLVKQAKGKYLCFLDDDETISPNYIETLLRMCNEGKDVCSFNALVKLENAWGIVNMSLNNPVNEEFTPDRIVNRPPWHMCPVKSEYAKLYEFSDTNNAEDFEWFAKVLTHCKTESKTNRIIFQYNHGQHSEADAIERKKNERL
jgi:glycosyltransferase involved in cell wall biosynthesis